MPYKLDPSTSGCYEGTSCLVNKLGIRDENELNQIEAQISFAKAVLLEKDSIEGNFDFEHYKRIHEFLFSDLYEWAGKIRTVDISKKRTRFMKFDHIEEEGQKIFSKVAKGCFENLSADEFAKEIALFYNDINYLHPFREGNGRAQRAYFTQLIRFYGYDINFSNIDADFFMIATIQASSGVLDFLEDFFMESIIIPDKNK